MEHVEEHVEIGAGPERCEVRTNLSRYRQSDGVIELLGAR